jgi:3-deoxy-D-manno-octulosonic-acid transferase
MARSNVLPVLPFLYRLGWTAARPFAAPLALIGGKFGQAVGGRRASAPALAEWGARARRPAMPLVWFHAASVGEGRQAEAVLTRVRAARPDWQLAYTFSSPSAERLAASLPADVVTYAPFDTVRDVGRVLEALRPTAIVFGATDVWPELVRQAHARGVLLALVSATLAPTSSRRGALARRLLAPAYAALDAVGAIDQADARALERLGVSPGRITVTGDTRHDAALARLSAVDRTAPHLTVMSALARGAAPIVLAGSTWPSDDRVLLPALGALRARGTPFRLVVAPHEPTPKHIEALEERIRRHLGRDAAVVRLSSLLASGNLEPLATGNLASGNQVVAVDRVGVLAELYVAASIAYVGGGFHRAGLHSVIEPAAAGVPVLFGPRHGGSRDARLLLDAGGARATRDRHELAAAVDRWLTNETARAAAGAAARVVVEQGQGAANRSLRLVISLVERFSPIPNP